MFSFISKLFKKKRERHNYYDLTSIGFYENGLYKHNGKELEHFPCRVGDTFKCRVEYKDEIWFARGFVNYSTGVGSSFYYISNIDRKSEFELVVLTDERVKARRERLLLLERKRFVMF